MGELIMSVWIEGQDGEWASNGESMNEAVGEWMDGLVIGLWVKSML
jgi:hypothetical protein